ncbi:hypothetical protein NSB1T_10405 [Coprobacter fastidiosus NSB1 = JCM 33896]|jgi:hypothetical protein|nr:hypothetical protein NSB1T_10405 [Coprobacter fastidiosus NSB1 = JCM 33896]
MVFVKIWEFPFLVKRKSYIFASQKIINKELYNHNKKIVEK